MTKRQPQWFMGRGHAFHPVYEICGICGMTRPQYEDKGKPKCPGRQIGRERPPVNDESDEPDSFGG
jgi:hypothetical protein